MATSIEELYEEHIKRLPPDMQLQLVEIIAREMAKSGAKAAKRNIMELHGLGAEIWNNVDAQEYVNELREEWNGPSCLH